MKVKKGVKVNSITNSKAATGMIECIYTYYSNKNQKEVKEMTLHQWGLVLEIVGFIFIAFFVGVILVFKSELGVKPFLDGEKKKVARLSGRFTFLQWFNKNNAITVFLAVLGTLIYFVGMLFQAKSTW